MAVYPKYNRLIREFRRHPIFTRDELLAFFHQDEPDLKKATIAWRIFDLKRRNIISDIKKGIYTLKSKPDFSPQLREQIITIGTLVDQQFGSGYNILDTVWLNDFIELQATTSLIVLETEKEQMESVFYEIKNEGFTEVFIKPDHGIVERHVSEAQNPVIIKPLISKSPTHSQRGIIIAELEKIIVDLFCDDRIYFGFQGRQLLEIYRNTTARYAINFSTLFTYAKRRNKEPEIKSLLLKVLDKDLKKILK